MINSSLIIDSSSINAIKARVHLFDGDTLVELCTCSDKLQSFSVSRVGESGKFFGFGICQQLKLTLIDLERELNVVKGMRVVVQYGDGTTFVNPHPNFYVEEAARNEETDTIDITAYDFLYNASNVLFADTEIPNNALYPYNPKETNSLMRRCIDGIVKTAGASFLTDTAGSITFINEPNLDGTETVADILKMCAETEQAIYYAVPFGLKVKGLSVSGDPVLTITKNDYYSLKVGENITLEGICHVTELGDNVSVGAESGTIQYVRENAFWESNYDNIAFYLKTAWNVVGGISINQFTCENWAGNFLLEIGDKIAFETEDGNIIAYLLDDVISFDGTLSQTTRWAYEMSDEEVASNPSSLGEAIKQTYARVDKANKKIEMVASETAANGSKISSLELDTKSISATVSDVKTSTDEAIGAINDNFETLSKQVSTKLDAEGFEVTVKEIVKEAGIDEVETSTGFTFNKDGLNISKSDSEMTTQITEDGMTIKRSGQETLVADNTGVRAENLHATTYLIIGTTSRFEDYGSNRIGCFWIGG